MKKIIIAMAGLATAIGVAWFSVETNQRPREQQGCVAKDVHEKVYAWIYDDSSRDEMSGMQIRIAAVLSQNSFAFGFPYDGEQHAMLCHPRTSPGRRKWVAESALGFVHPGYTKLSG